jgi:hypothetical protein
MKVIYKLFAKMKGKSEKFYHFFMNEEKEKRLGSKLIDLVSLWTWVNKQVFTRV